MLNDINFVNTNTHEIYFCGEYRKVKNCRMKTLQDYNKKIQELAEHNQKINEKVSVLKNKLEKIDDLEEYDKIQNQIKEIEDDLYSDDELMKKQVELAPLLIDNITPEECIEKMELQDQDIIYALPGMIKLLLARADEAKINNYAREYITASADSNINQIRNQFL